MLGEHDKEMWKQRIAQLLKKQWKKQGLTLLLVAIMLFAIYQDYSTTNQSPEPFFYLGLLLGIMWANFQILSTHGKARETEDLAIGHQYLTWILRKTTGHEIWEVILVDETSHDTLFFRITFEPPKVFRWHGTTKNIEILTP